MANEKKTITGNDGNDTEVALAAFAGKCHNCHQVGHRAADCPHKKNKNKSNKNKHKCCSHCGKMGHVKVNCWIRPENSNKHPKWYKPPCVDGNEQSNAAVDDGDIDPLGELLCMAVGKKMTFPSVAELLKDPCVWIGDTGATKHITQYTQGMKNMKQDRSGTGITMGNDTVAKGTHTSDLPGTQCDHQGNQLDNVVLTNVSVVPSSAFNLFSITKMQLQGWVLGGDKDTLWITKGHRTICFDIKIETPEGCVFAMYVTRGNESEMINVAAEGNNNKTTMTFQQVHDHLGHMSDATTRETAKQLGSRIRKTQTFPCTACAAGKAKQKNIKRAETTKQKMDIDGLTWTLQQLENDKECPSHQNPTGESSLWINVSKSSSPGFSRPRMQWLSQHVSNYTNGSNQTLVLLT